MANGIFGVGRPLGPAAPGLSGAINPLMFLGSGMATGNIGGAMGQLANIQQNAQQLSLNRQQMAQDQIAQRAANLIAQQRLAHQMSKPTGTSLEQNLAAAGLAPGTPEYQQAVMDYLQKSTAPTINIGEKLPANFRWRDPSRPELGVEPIPGGPATKPSEKQQDVAAYVQNAEVAERMLGELEGWTPTGAIAARNPVSRLLASEVDRRASDYQLAWTMAVLRAESGAVISPSEAAQQIHVYFDQPGDTDQQKADKQALRAAKMDSMRKRAGGAYEPLELQEVETTVEVGPGADATIEERANFYMEKYGPQATPGRTRNRRLR